jgi:hypothetical protein
MNSNSNYRGRSPYHRLGRCYRGKSKTSNRRGGNSRNYGKSNKSSRYNSTCTTKEYKFAPHTHGNTTYATYSTVKDVIITYIKKHYKTGLDIDKSIKEGGIIDMTTKAPTVPVLSPQRLMMPTVNWNRRPLTSSTRKN